MKTFSSIIILFFLFINQNIAQNLPDAKRDQVWVMGLTKSDTSNSPGGIKMTFSEDSLMVDSFDIRLNFARTNAMISDTSGKLVFYFNGLFVANAENQIMENGFGLNPGPLADFELNNDSFYLLQQGGLALPRIGFDKQYYLFHSTLEEPTLEFPLFHVPRLLLTTVDMNANNGSGKVIEKNKVIIEDTLTNGELTAVRHANGEDWWMILATLDANEYYRLLIKGDTIIQKPNQIIGDSVLSRLSQTVFTPDGTKYIRFNASNQFSLKRLDVFDFDRCAGLLSNPVQFIIPNDTIVPVGGVAVSPNSRFLYVPSGLELYQYDLEAPDIQASRTTIAQWDSTYSPSWPLATFFYMAQLAPDGKIYINSPNGVDVMHVIHNPNEQGLACNFEQRGIQLPFINAFTMPNFPNFRLGASAEPCIDSTTSIKTLSSTPSIPHQLYPNPANDVLYLALESPLPKAGRLLLYNGLGQQVLVEELEKEIEQKELDLSGLEQGLYFYVLEVEGRIVGQGKVVVGLGD